MGLTRRDVLCGAAAFVALPAKSQEGRQLEQLHARVADMQLLPEAYGRTSVWGYSGTMPGPEIRLPQGARVQRRLRNALPQSTSTHWHGIRIDNAMDGVAGLTQPAVAPGETFDYDFIVPDAGTYWYHAHNRSFEQVARGLYGALIVEEPDPIDIDREEVLILDDWLLDPDTGQISEPFGAPHDLSHAGRIGNLVGTNVINNLTFDVDRHERLRLRLINAANARLFELALDGLEGWIVAIDGMPLPTPRSVSDSFLMGPAQRVDLIVDVTADLGGSAHLVRIDRQQAFSQVAFEVRGDTAVPQRDAPRPLPPNARPRVDLADARSLSLRMEGGAMGGMRSAMMGGTRRSLQEMMQAGQFWAFNGAVGGMDGPPLIDLSLGETVRLTIVNDTAFPHAMHVHGTHFYEIAPDGSLGEFRDTTMLMRGETREIAIVAENPGDWLLHCHMLSHAASGMMTWLRVQA